MQNAKVKIQNERLKCKIFLRKSLFLHFTLHFIRQLAD
jgi:hypothetical protein